MRSSQITRSHAVARPRLGGFTLIEGVVSIAVTAALGIVFAQTFQYGVRQYLFASEVASKDAIGRILLERVSRDLRMVRSANDISTFTATQFAYTDTTGAFIRYQYNSASRSLTRQENTGTARTLADTISGLTFSYLQSDGVTAASAVDNLNFIQISATISSSNVSAVYRTSVAPLAY